MESYIPTVLATFVEPIWVVLNRILCMLQPYEELRRGKAIAQKSLIADYASLPPQFAFWRAFRSGHVILGAVCWMALLANLLTVAFSTLFFEADVGIPHPANISSSLQTYIRGDILHDFMNTPVDDHFYVAMSNLTARTPMPPFTDDSFFYLPFDSTSSPNATWQYRATTKALGAQLDCVPLLSSGPNSISVTERGRTNITFKVKIDQGHAKSPCEEMQPVFCFDIASGAVALEVVFSACGTYLVSGWMRANLTPNEAVNLKLIDLSKSNLDSVQSTFLACRSKLITGMSDVLVDSAGIVQQASLLNKFDSPPKSWFVGTSVDLLERMLVVWGPSSGRYGAWHNDSYPTDFYNYLISKATNSSRLLDPALPVPSAEEATPLISALYSKLFAIVLGNNVAAILPDRTESLVTGSIIKPTTRIFMSRPMFVVSEVVLALYVVVTVLVYVHRPWRFLPRLPTSIASVVAFFAASHAVLDLRGTSALSTKERNDHVKRQNHRYGYGRFIGTDGLAKVGIERYPYLLLNEADTVRTDKNWLTVLTARPRRWFG